MSAAERTAALTLEQLMAQAHALECESEQRYLELADILAIHNNREVADLFRSIAAQEGEHAAQIRQRMGWDGTSPHPARISPSLPDLDRVHYLMQPWHVIQIALESERKAHAFFGQLAAACEPGALREAARELQAEEAGHVALLEEWLDRVPVPTADWDHDPDPPRNWE